MEMAIEIEHERLIRQRELDVYCVQFTCHRGGIDFGIYLLIAILIAQQLKKVFIDGLLGERYELINV